MKKYILIAVALCLSISGFSQNDTKVQFEKKGDLTEATYFYENGSVEQQGTFNSEGELHGEWISYDINGQKLAVGKYLNGQKHGKWFFWKDETLTEVDYINSRITSVNEWNDKTRVAIRNK
ncbi:MAG: nicotinic acid mononucleotide adenyltransferase [Flavobacteriaceae bacterium]|nr:nicotinic acid mononucleotide adenyltransferase [Flavobacteriaceae bacterium]